MSVQPPLTVFVVGAGRTATALSGALHRAGVAVLGLWGRREASVHAAANAAGVAGYTGPPPADVIGKATSVIVCVSDQAIAEVAQSLWDCEAISEEHILLHCSGSISASAAFSALPVHGQAVMHPLRAIDDGAAGIETLRSGVTFGVQGDAAGAAFGIRLVDALGGHTLNLQGVDISAYHAAATIVSNYVVGLVDIGAELIAGLGIPYDDAVAALLPLAQGSLENVERRGLPAGLTGPIRRGDEMTVQRHIGVLANSPDLLQLYRLLGLRVVAIANRADHGDPVDRLPIEALLQS